MSRETIELRGIEAGASDEIKITGQQIVFPSEGAQDKPPILRRSSQ
jgi:hypothetical protein